MKINVITKYLELDPVGPIISGDIVLQGTLLSPIYGPALCKVEYLAEHDDTFVEVTRICPWEMMIDSPETGRPNGSFTIPISIGSGYDHGNLKYTIFVDDVSRIPYAGHDDAFDLTAEELLIPTVEYIAVTSVNNFDSAGVILAQGDRVVNSLKIISRMDVVNNKAVKGFNRAVVFLSEEGARDDIESPWPFLMFASHAPLGSEGIEDILWVRTPKHSGILADVPDGYIFDEDVDFSADGDEVYYSISTVLV